MICNKCGFDMPYSCCVIGNYWDCSNCSEAAKKPEVSIKWMPLTHDEMYADVTWHNQYMGEYVEGDAELSFDLYEKFLAEEVERVSQLMTDQIIRDSKAVKLGPSTGIGGKSGEVSVITVDTEAIRWDSSAKQVIAPSNCAMWYDFDEL